MARLQIPPLEASDGTLAIVYRVASHVYGEWNVTWPQDYDAPELQPGRTQGYVSRLPGGEPPPFGRRFVRQDVSIDAINGESNVERTLDEAADSLSGEVVVEREIGPEGLGNLKLGVDFNKGDLVPVAIATKVLELPVTRATYRDEAGQLTEPTIGVGYSLLVDRSGLASHNEESERRIAADLRDLAPRLKAVETTARDNATQVDVAKKTASDAKTVAQTANSAASRAQASADSKSTVFYGATTPAKAKAGDTWFKDLAGGGTVLMQYVDGKWVEKVNAKAIDDELAANQEALTELNNVTLPGLKEELEALDTEVAREAAAKLATLETKLANADKALKQDLQGELAALDEALSGELTSSLAGLKEELEALDADVARDAAAKLAALETKLANADKALKQDLQGELAALDEALSGELTSSLANLKEDLEAADAAGAEAIATTLVQLENRLKAADKALKTDLVAQLGELEADLAALDTAMGENLTAKLAALRTELQRADTAVTSTLRGELSTLKTQLQNADAALKTDLVGQLNAARKALENADDAVANDLSKRLEDARKGLKAASDAIAKDLAGVDMLVENQRPGNLFPDPFFKHSLWGSRYNAEEECLEITATGSTTGAYYFPDGYNVYSHLMTLEPGASYLLTIDARFGGNEVVKHATIYCRYCDVAGDWKTAALGRIDRTNEVNYKWGTTSLVLTMPDNVSSEATLGFYISSEYDSGHVRLRNVRLHRAADNSLIIDGAVTAAKVKAGVIDADHIAAGAIVSTKLAADSVVAGKIAANAVTANSIAANQVTTAKIAAGAVTANEILSDTILAKNIKAGQITTAKIAADAVTANEIAANAVTANAIKAGEVTAGKIAANAVTANEIAADQVLAKHVKAGQITTSKIATDAVTANEIASNQILAKHIKAGEITTAKIAANQITTAKIAAGAVTADELQAENATIDKLWANGIAAKSVTTNRILVAGNGNMLPEISSYHGSGYPNPDPYEDFGKNSGDPSMWLKGRTNAYIRQPINIVAGQKYRLRYQARASVNGTSHYLFIRQGNPDGPTNPSDAIKTKVNGGSSESTYLVADGKVGTGWGSFDVTFEPSTTEVAYIYIYANHTNGTDNPNYQWFKDVRLEKMTGATLIEDGAITTDKIAANAVTANAIKADAITANAIKAGEVAAKHLAADAVSATKLLAEDATIDKLWANGLAAKSITASRLTVSPGNMFPDPNFQDPSWDSLPGGVSRISDGISLNGDGTMHGVYFQPEGQANASMRHEPGVNYLMTAHLRFGGNANISRFSVYARMKRDTGVTGATKVGEFVRFPTDGQAHASYRYMDNSAVLDFSSIKMAPGGYFTLGFFVESSEASGNVEIRDVRLTKMSGTTLIEDGAITTGKVAADAITANEIKADQILSKHVKADQIMAKHVKSGEIKAEHLLAEEATIDKLWTNGLVAKAVQTSSLAVGPANLYRDPALLDANSFDSRRSDTGGYGGGGSFTVAPSTAQVGGYDTLGTSRGRPTRLIPGVTYYISVMVRPDRVVAADKVKLFLRAYPNENASGSISWASPSSLQNDVTLTGGKWARIEGTFVMPEGNEYLVLGFYVQSGASAQVIFSDPLIIRQYSSTMIQDGAITTGKVAANAITANEIKSGQITSDHISSSKISSDKITVKNGFIKNAMIGDGQIDNAKIANLDASKINAGTISANRIGAKTITGSHLAVDTIEADQIKANVFTQVANSVLPLIPGTVTPTWTDGLKYIPRSGTKDAELPAGIPGYYRHPSGTVAAGASVTVDNTYRNVVSIDPNLEYEATWWVRSSSGSPRYIYVTLEDQNGNTDIVQKVEGVDDNGDALSKHTWGNPIRVIITSASTTWTKYSTLFTFKEGTKSVRVNNVHFNNGSNSNAAYLYIAGLEISPHIIAQREIDIRQDQSIAKIQEYVDQMMDTFYSQSAAYAKKFNELSEPMSGVLEPGTSTPDDHIISATTSKITCHGDWSGYILMSYMYSKDIFSTQYAAVTGSTRSFYLPSRVGSVAIHWHRRPGRAYTQDMSTGAYAMPQGAWTTVSTATVGTGDWNLSATVGWDAANNHGAYGIRILVDGSEVARVAPRTGLGPLLPIGDGYRTQSLSASGNGNGRSTKFEIQAYIGEGNVSQRRIRRVKATLDWTKLN